jgi:hypothetical protein
MGGLRNAVAVTAVCIVVVSGQLAGGAAAVPSSSPPAASNEPPVASAGLDQEVTVNDTVYLDATGSIDPDGSIASYRWEIEAPDGSIVTPDCTTCGRTRFVADANGQYNVTVTVTDDDGASRSDTLYVDATDRETLDVTLSGQDSVVSGYTATYVASITAGETTPSRIEWYHNGTLVHAEPLDESTNESEIEITFGDTGTDEVSVRVQNRLGLSVSESQSVEVQTYADANPAVNSELVRCGYIYNYHPDGSEKASNSDRNTVRDHSQVCSEYFENDIRITDSTGDVIRTIEANGERGYQGPGDQPEKEIEDANSNNSTFSSRS